MRYFYLVALAMIVFLCGCVPVQQERITTIHPDGGGTSTIITVMPDMPMVRGGYSDFASRLPYWTTHSIYNRGSELCFEIDFPFNSIYELNARMKILKGFTSHIEQFEFKTKPKELGCEYILSVDLTRNTSTERASDARIYTKYTVQMPGERVGLHTIAFNQAAVNGKRYFFSDYYAPVMTWVDLNFKNSNEIEANVTVGLDQMEMNSSPWLSGQWEKYKAGLNTKIPFGSPENKIFDEEGIKFDAVSFRKTFTNPYEIFSSVDLPSCNKKCGITTRSTGFIKKTYATEIIIPAISSRNYQRACYRLVLPGKIIDTNGAKKSENMIEWLVGGDETEYLKFSYEAVNTEQLVFVIILPAGFLLFVFLLIFFARRIAHSSPQQKEQLCIYNVTSNPEDHP